MESLDEVKKREAERHRLRSILRGEGERSNLFNTAICLAAIVLITAVAFGFANMDFAFRYSADNTSNNKSPVPVEAKNLTIQQKTSLLPC